MAITMFLIRTHKILDAIDPDEYDALSANNKQVLALIISATFADMCEGTLTRTLLWDMFGEGSTSRANIEAVIPENLL